MSLTRSFLSEPLAFLFHPPKPNPNPPSPSPSLSHRNSRRRRLTLLSPLSASPTPDLNPPSKPTSSPKRRTKPRPPKPKNPPSEPSAAAAGAPTSGDTAFPATIPRKPRPGRRSEAAAVEDFVRDSLGRTFASIREQSGEVFEGKEEILKERIEEEQKEEEEEERGHVVEEEDPDWPVDADVGWGIRASEYFERHPIRNVVVDGVVIDWEGEMDEGWVKEINCLEWESFAFHPSPLIVLVFERYNRAADNWKLLKELEKATKVYWDAKDRLPPRTVKIDINIERDLAYALKVKEGPQLLFLKGNKILYREKEIRTADELVHMIAHFYYNAKKPSWIDDSAVAPPF